MAFLMGDRVVITRHNQPCGVTHIARVMARYVETSDGGTYRLDGSPRGAARGAYGAARIRLATDAEVVCGLAARLSRVRWEIVPAGTIRAVAMMVLGPKVAREEQETDE